jgi:hypothetical protein
MDTDDDPWVAPWTVVATLASAILAALAFALGVPYGSHAAAVAAAGATYVLYKWGQHRERSSTYSDDSDEKRREMEQEGRSGGYGGNP